MAEQTKRKYDATVARIAGNVLSGLFQVPQSKWTTELMEQAVESSVRLARAIVAEVERTEPEAK